MANRKGWMVLLGVCSVVLAGAVGSALAETVYTPFSGEMGQADMKIGGTAAGYRVLDWDEGDFVGQNGQYDQFGTYETTSFSSTATLNVTLEGGFEPNVATDTFKMFELINLSEADREALDVTTPAVWDGWFTAITLPGPMSGGDWYWEFTYEDGSVGRDTPTAPFVAAVLTAGAQVPEPSTILLLASGGLGLALAAWRKRRS